MTTRISAAPVVENSRSKMLLHWLLAISILFLFVSSWWMLSLPLPSAEYTYRVLPFQLHKNIGMTVFLIILIMIVMRARRRVVSDPESKSLMRLFADIDQWAIYVTVFICCLSGYLSSSYSGWDTELWWLLTLPAWAAENDELNIVFSDIHQWTCWLLILMVVLHIAAALYHGLLDDKQLNKMIP